MKRKKRKKRMPVIEFRPYGPDPNPRPVYFHSTTRLVTSIALFAVPIAAWLIWLLHSLVAS